MKHTYRTAADRLPPVGRPQGMPRPIWATAYDADGVEVGFTVIDLPDGHSGVPPWPSPAPSDSFFATETEAAEEVTERLDGKDKCHCGCGAYPRGPARFVPGHDPQQRAR